MVYILVKDKTAINVDSEKEKLRRIKDGWRVLTSSEISAAGMSGYEHMVSPVNTKVDEDGTITFTPPPEPTLEEVRTAALSRIDSATSAAILAGFEYEVETGEGKEVLHFSYLADDQQNFSDTANGALLAMQGVESVPNSVKWNGWRNHSPEYKGDLVRLVLDVPSFLMLYTQGALAHKATQMEVGGQRKAAIEAAETVEEINALLEGWGV